MGSLKTALHGKTHGLKGSLPYACDYSPRVDLSLPRARDPERSRRPTDVV
jgi:hypothetical protein